MSVSVCLCFIYICHPQKIKVCLSVSGFVLILSVCLSVCLLNSLSTTSPSVFCRQQQHQHQHHQQGRPPITSGWRGIYEDRFMGQRNEEMERKMRSRCQEDITSSTRVSRFILLRRVYLFSHQVCAQIYVSSSCRAYVWFYISLSTTSNSLTVSFPFSFCSIF